MLKFLGVIALIAVVLVIAFVVAKIVVSVKYGWPSKIPFYIIEFLNVDKNSNWFSIGYLINGECYRLKLRQFKTYELAKQSIDSMVNAINSYSTKKKLISASYCVPEDRIINVTDLSLVPTWAFKLMNFSISLCFSKTSK